MTIREEIKQLPSGKKDLRSFAWTVGGALVALWAVLRWVIPYLFDKGGDVPVLWGLGVALAALGTVVPRVLKPIYYLWMGIALTLGLVMTRVILTIFFFIVLTPVGLFFRLIGRDALHRKLEPRSTSYWIEKEYLIPDRSRYEKFF